MLGLSNSRPTMLIRMVGGSIRGCALSARKARRFTREGTKNLGHQTRRARELSQNIWFGYCGGISVSERLKDLSDFKSVDQRISREMYC